MNKSTEKKFTEEKILQKTKELAKANSMVRRQARWDLILAGSYSIPFLSDILQNSKSVRVRKEAIKALSEIEDERVIPILVSALEDQSYEVRWDAAVGLIEHRQSSLIPLFCALKVNFGSSVLREGAHHVLRILRKKMVNSQVEEVYAALESLAPEIELPWAVSKALRELNNHE